MQIVINISEESYKNIKEQVDKRDYPDMQIGRAIADGVLIPECHGRLVDIDLLRDQVSHDEREAFSKHQVWLLLSVHNKNIPTILDADEAYTRQSAMAKHYISKLVVPCLDEETHEIEYSLYSDGTYEIKEILYDKEEEYWYRKRNLTSEEAKEIRMQYANKEVAKKWQK